MAINPSTLSGYNGQVDAPGASYPYGSARDDSTPGDLTGTPRIASEVNDWFGFAQALLGAAAIVPSGSPDTATTSQYLNALRQVVSELSGTMFTDITALQAGTALDGSTVLFSKLAAKRALVRTRWRDTSREDGAFYIIWEAAAYVAAYGGAPDGTEDFYVGGGTDYVAQMTSTAAPRFKAGTNALVNAAAIRDPFYVGRTLAGLTDCHAYADRTVIDTPTDAGTYGTFDSVTTVQGNHTQSHQFSFQDRAIYNGSGTISNWAAHIVWPQAPGSGTVSQRYGMWFKDVDQMGGGGTIASHIGIYMEDLNNAVSNVAFNIQQASGFAMFAPNAGKWQIGGEFAVTAQAVFGVTVPVSGVAATFSRGNVGDQKAFVSSNSGAGTFGVEGDHKLEFINNAANRMVLEASANGHALRPESTTQNLGMPTKEWNINYLKQVNFEPIASATASNLSLFVDTADGDLKYKSSTGTVRTLSYT
jgi:hypothetical protein